MKTQFSSYHRLDAGPIRHTIAQLERRVDERFPHSGLRRVARELARLGSEAEREIARLRRPLWWLRGLIALAILAVLGTVGWIALRFVRVASRDAVGLPDLLQGVDAGTNQVVVLALTLFFLASLETRLKRRRALRMLHRLRSLAHVIDMHQLAKDPEYALQRARPTASSPERPLGRADTARYLDYCSEMLALVSKLAALHTEHLDDPVVLAAAGDVEALTTGLSGKIWQKIVILNSAASTGTDSAGE